jgi:hypothetical protein
MKPEKNQEGIWNNGLQNFSTWHSLGYWPFELSMEEFFNVEWTEFLGKYSY